MRLSVVQYSLLNSITLVEYYLILVLTLVMLSTSVLSTKMATKQQFWENTTCRQKLLFCWHNNVLFWKRKDTFKKQYIVKISLQKGMTVCEKCAFKWLQWHACAQPTTVYLASLDDPLRSSKFGFWSEHQVCIYFLTIVLLTIVAVGMKFDPTCRQRNLSSTTALIRDKLRDKMAVADPRGGRIGRGPPFFWPIFVFLEDFFYFRARHRGIWIPGPPFSQILDPPLKWYHISQQKFIESWPGLLQFEFSCFRS